MNPITPSRLVVASFDIGIVNFAFVVESVDIETLRVSEADHASLPAWARQRVKFAGISPTTARIVKEVCENGVVLKAVVKNLRKEASDVASEDLMQGGLSVLTRRALFAHLERYISVWSMCDIFVFEQQYFNTFSGRGRSKTMGANVKALKVAECVLTWFLLRYPTKMAVVFTSSLKTQMLGAEDRLSKPERKRWAIQKATEILTARGDTRTLKRFAKYKKRGQKLDDLSDCIIQCQAFKLRYLVGNFAGYEAEAPPGTVYRRMTLPNLRRECKAKGIRGYSKLKKRALIAALMSSPRKK